MSQDIKKQQIGKGAVILTAAKILALVISMISAAVLSHCRSLTEYGTYSEILLVVNLAVSLFSCGLPNSLNYFVASTEDAAERKKFLSHFYTLNTVLSLLCGVVLLVSTPLIVSYFNDNQLIKSFLYVLAILPWIKIVSSSIENLYVVYGKTKNLVIYRFAHGISVLVVAVLMAVFNWKFSLYMAVYMIVEFIFTAYIYIVAGRLCGGLRLAFNIKYIKRIFAFSIPIGISSVIGTINIEIDKLLIGKLMTTEELAVYTNSSKELPLTFIATSLTAVLMPALVRKLKENKNIEAVNLWKSATIISFAIMSLFSAGVFVFAKEVIVVLYSEKYLSGIWVFRVYNLVLLLRCTYFGIILNSIGKTKLIMYSSIGSLILNSVLNLAFYKFFGFVGPAIATFVAIFVIDMLQLIATSRVINVKIKDIFAWKYIFIFLMENAALAVIFTFIKNKIITSDNSTINIIIAVLLGCVWAVIFAVINRKTIVSEWKKLN